MSNLPPGQYEVNNWPVLTASKGIELPEWTLQINGLVDNPVTLSLDQLMALQKQVQKSDFHCVTTWSLLNTQWTGVSWKVIQDLVKPKIEAKYVLQYSNDEIEYTTGTLLSELEKENVIIAYAHDDTPISYEHGGPIRLIIPHLYAYKSAKWLKKIEFLPEKKLGFWETKGYSELADPWQEQRYTEDDLAI